MGFIENFFLKMLWLNNMAGYLVSKIFNISLDTKVEKITDFVEIAKLGVLKKPSTISWNSRGFIIFIFWRNY